MWPKIKTPYHMHGNYQLHAWNLWAEGVCPSSIFNKECVETDHRVRNLNIYLPAGFMFIVRRKELIWCAVCRGMVTTCPAVLHLALTALIVLPKLARSLQSWFPEKVQPKVQIIWQCQKYVWEFLFANITLNNGP